MGLINRTSAKQFYTPAQDATIVALANEGKSVAEISAVVGHSVASVQYRIGRVLSKVESLDAIKYRGQSVPVVASAEVAATEEE